MVLTAVLVKLEICDKAGLLGMLALVRSLLTLFCVEAIGFGAAFSGSTNENIKYGMKKMIFWRGQVCLPSSIMASSSPYMSSYSSSGVG